MHSVNFDKYIRLFSYKLPIVCCLLLSTINIGCTSEQDDLGEQGHYGVKNLANSAKYNVQLGLGYLEQGDVERAKDKFLKAVKQSPRMPEAHYNLAHFYYLIDEQDLARQHFGQAVEYASDSTTGVLGTAHNNFGVFLCQTKKFKEADQHFMQAIADVHYADTASAFENAGLCALKGENKQQAKYYFEKAIKNNPLAQKALIELAQLSVDSKNYSKATFYLERYKQLAPNDRRLLLLSLQIAKSIGTPKEAIKISRVILQKYPDIKEQVNTDGAKIPLTISKSNSVTYTQLGKLSKIA